ncbi:MAG: hypothetical protein IRY85_02515 [Micromonosporaceae bacterium]|nr:hypothetical protein [Micromonosporaceae bacterium]
MQPGEFELAVNPASMLAHGATIGAVAEEVEVARAAAEVVRLDRGAYGQVCAFVPDVLNRLSDDLMAGLRTAADSLHETSARLTAAAREFAAADSDVQRGFGGYS